MKIAVRYFSRGGNTKKLADAIGNALGVEVLSVSEPLKEDVDVLFLGSSVYAYGVDDEIKRFVNELSVKVGHVVNFSTAAVIKSTYKQVSKLLQEKNITLEKEEFACRGSFGPMHKGKPDEEDLRKAADFAKEVIKKWD